MGGIVDSIFGGGDDYPDADPNIGTAAKLNAETAQEMLDWYKQVYADSKPRQAQLDALTQKVTQTSLDTSNQNLQQARAQWERYGQLFAPVEEQVVKDATDYDSDSNLSRVSGEAASGVQAQYKNALGQQRRQMAAMGVNPNSGRAAALEKEGALGLAAAKAGAANTARTTAVDKGIALRAGAANFGRNMPNTASNAYSTSIAGGNSAVQNTVAAGNAANANAALMGQGYSSAMQGFTNTANVLQNQYNSQLNAWNMGQQNSSADAAGVGNLSGMLGSAWLMSSSKKVKTDKRKIDANTVIRGIRKTPVEKWRYKDGEGDGGEHVGPYAEDVQKAFGDTVAPGGKAIDIVSLLGVNMAATQALDDKITDLEKSVKRHGKSKRGAERK